MYLIEIIKAVVFGIIEGITEWLPISSTGHLILANANEFVKLDASEKFTNMFFVVIQLGAILAVITMFFKKLNPFSPSKSKTEKSDTWSLLFKILVATVPAGIIGFLFDDIIEKKLYNYVVVSIMLIVYGILFIIVEKTNKSKQTKVNSFSELSFKTALLIGGFQMLALIPGTSRSGATILGAILLGLNRGVAAEFSFFLAIPVMLGASLLKLLKFGFSFSGIEVAVLLSGMVTAFIVSVLAIKFLVNYVRKNDFVPFGIYRIVLGCIVLGYFIIFV